jgi:tetratricopeptide (TPR) repeat protein
MGAEIVSDNLQNLEMSDAHADRPSQPDDLVLRRSQQLEFLLKLLRSINENNRNPDIIYSLLRQNLDLLDFDMIEVMKIWVADKFTEIDQDSQGLIASCVFNFGDLIQQFPLGNKAVNMEFSIECYTAALKVYRKEDFPVYWGATQNSLAIAFLHRIEGDRAENLERAIEGYLSSLEFRTKTNSPASWAMTQNNLAAVYSMRICGDRSENLERAIELNHSALEIYTKEELPIEWAITQNNLAVAYAQRIKGDRAKNLERSIEFCHAALEIRNKAKLSIDWAETQSNMAIAYSERINGDSAKNLEYSINCSRAALEIYTAESFPYEWARIQVDLARVSIEQLQNYQVATEHLQSAYEHLLANNNDTGLLAQTMFELARCFHKTGCLGQAKIYFKDSVRLYQRLEQPTQVAAVTSALGNLELQMGAIDDARIHLQTALEFYQAAGNLDRVASIQELQQCLPEHSPEPAL